MNINNFDEALIHAVDTIAVFGNEEVDIDETVTMLDLAAVLAEDKEFLERVKSVTDIDELRAELEAEIFAIRMDLAEFVATYGPEV